MLDKDLLSYLTKSALQLSNARSNVSDSFEQLKLWQSKLRTRGDTEYRDWVLSVFKGIKDTEQKNSNSTTDLSKSTSPMRQGFENFIKEQTEIHYLLQDKMRKFKDTTLVYDSTLPLTSKYNSFSNEIAYKFPYSFNKNNLVVSKDFFFSTSTVLADKNFDSLILDINSVVESNSSSSNSSSNMVENGKNFFTTFHTFFEQYPNSQNFIFIFFFVVVVFFVITKIFFYYRNFFSANNDLLQLSLKIKQLELELKEKDLYIRSLNLMDKGTLPTEDSVDQTQMIKVDKNNLIN